MKVGDLVRWAHPQSADRSMIATVIEVGVYVGRKNTKVLWVRTGEISPEKCKHLEKIEKS